MQIDLSQITRDDAEHVLAHYDRGGVTADDDFTRHLIAALATASFTDFQHLVQGWPGLGAAVYCAREADGGFGILLQIAAHEAAA
ncbi:hypothetical protein [Streptomyces sp. MJP52]|uniref:hypothetical protein n=1 Tax=Streptomyces sp. MJP52 TaxID=2940555 RepID=UPI002473F31A|nr:hypothetical protein [Streptomyces sp. MJP52]MDH6226244.1 hypothetical protein [Streptomyces sp. MJP52]